MADEALRELAAWLQTEAMDRTKMVPFVAHIGDRKRLLNDATKIRWYADALESALSELARLRAEKNSDPVALHAAVHGQSLPESDPGETAGSLVQPHEEKQG